MKFATMAGVLDLEPPELFDTAARLGFDGVELDWNDPAQAEPGGLYEPEAREGLREAAHEAGVEIHGVCAHFLNQGSLNSEDEPTRRVAYRAVEIGIELCRDLGATALLLPFFGDATLQSAQLPALADDLKTLAARAEAAGVGLAVESTLPAPDVMQLCESVGSPYVGAYWDMGNAMCWGLDPVAEVRALGGHLVRVHAKEFFRTTGLPRQWQDADYSGLNAKPFGEGLVPVRDVLAALREVGYESYVTLETASFGDQLASAQAALLILRALSSPC